jgi:hypothetical protein
MVLQHALIAGIKSGSSGWLITRLTIKIIPKKERPGGETLNRERNISNLPSLDVQWSGTFPPLKERQWLKDAMQNVEPILG